MTSIITRTTGPRDLPRLRSHLYDQWRAGGPLAQAIEGHRAILRAEGHAAAIGDSAMHARPEYVWNQGTLRDATLWWVSEEMCDLLAAAETGLPDDTVLDETLIPQSKGLVVFAKTLHGIDSAGNAEPVRVDAIAWGPVWIVDERHGHPEEFAALGIASYRRLDFDQGLSAVDMGLLLSSGAGTEEIESFFGQRGTAMATLHGEAWAPLGRADWIARKPVNDRHEGIDSDAALASMVEDRKRLATLWLLASQPGIAESHQDHGDRAHRRREQRAGRTPSPVTIITLPKRPSAPHRPDTEPTGRHVSVRFPVEGFWRNQAYGPGHSLRRPTWIPAHWRGPADAPVRVPEKVRVVRGLTDEELQPGE